MWHAVTPESLRAAVTGAERNALDTAALAPEQTDALREIAANIIAEWRGGLRRVTTLDRRPDHLPAEIMVHVLADFRYRAFTRLPFWRCCNLGRVISDDGGLLELVEFFES